MAFTLLEQTQFHKANVKQLKQRLDPAQGTISPELGDLSSNTSL